MNFTPNITGEGTESKQEYPSQRFFEYAQLLEAVGDAELTALADLPIFSREFLLHTSEGGRFTLDFKDVILYDGQLSDNTASDSLDHALNKSSTIEVTIISALDQLNDLRARLEIDFEEWLAEQHEIAENEIKDERRLQIKEKERKELGMITTQQIKDYMINTNPELYSKSKLLIHDVKNEIKYLEDLIETIRSRAIRIMSILNRRYGK